MRFIRLFPVVTLLLLASQPSWSQSRRTYDECVEMVAKYAQRHIEKGDKATDKHRETVQRLVADFVQQLPEDEQVTSDIPGVIDRLVAGYAAEASYTSLITEAVATAQELEDSPDFVCPYEYSVRHWLIDKANAYEARLGRIEDAIRERLDLETLEADEGLVVVSFQAEGYAEHIVINRLGGIGGGIKFGPLRDEEFFRIFKVKAGEYEWNKIWSSGWRYRTSMYVKRGDFTFSVEAGKLNYIGKFLYRNSWSRGDHASVRDRASVVLTELEEHYPEILDKYGMRNGLYPDDRFFDFYLHEKQAALESDDGA